jgi:anti-anti-sigma factor
LDLEVERSLDGAERPCTTLAVTGFVDLSTSEALLDAGLRILWAGSCLALDLAGVDFMDAAGVSALAALRLAAQREGATVEFTAVSWPVARVLQILQLTQQWSVPLPAATVTG